MPLLRYRFYNNIIKALTLRYSYVGGNLDSLRDYKNLRLNLSIILFDEELLVDGKYYISLDRRERISAFRSATILFYRDKIARLLKKSGIYEDRIRSIVKKIYFVKRRLF